MPETAVVSSPLECLEGEAIIAQIRTAMADIMSIHNEELASVISGNLGPRDASIDHRLKELRELKALLMERFQRHRAEHGC
jgi:hypothetical protein